MARAADDDRREIDSALAHTFWIRGGAFERIEIRLELQHLLEPARHSNLKVVFQTNSAIDRQNVQAVFVYRYRPPFGRIQLAYQRGTAEFGERSEQGNTFFFRLTAVF